MLINSILILIVALALQFYSFFSVLFLRIAAIVLIYSGALSINAFYIQSIGSGIGIYSNFYHITFLSQYIDTFIFYIAYLILIVVDTLHIVSVFKFNLHILRLKLIRYFTDILIYFIIKFYKLDLVIQYAYLYFTNIFRFIYRKTNSNIFLYLFFPFIWRLNYVHAIFIYYYFVIFVIVCFNSFICFNLFLVQHFQAINTLINDLFLDRYLVLHLHECQIFNPNGIIYQNQISLCHRDCPDIHYRFPIKLSSFIDEDNLAMTMGQIFHGLAPNNNEAVVRFNRLNMLVQISSVDHYTDPERELTLDQIVTYSNMVSYPYVDRFLIRGAVHLPVFNYEDRMEEYFQIFQLALSKYAWANDNTLIRRVSILPFLELDTRRLMVMPYINEIYYNYNDILNRSILEFVNCNPLEDNWSSLKTYYNIWLKKVKFSTQISELEVLEGSVKIMAKSYRSLAMLSLYHPDLHPKWVIDVDIQNSHCIYHRIFRCLPISEIGKIGFKAGYSLGPNYTLDELEFRRFTQNMAIVNANPALNTLSDIPTKGVVLLPDQVPDVDPDPQLPQNTNPTIKPTKSRNNTWLNLIKKVLKNISR